MADVTYYVAMPYLQTTTGAPVAALRRSATVRRLALRRAEVLAKAAVASAAVASPHRRSDDREFSDAKLLKKFGDVRIPERAVAVIESIVGWQRRASRRCPPSQDRDRPETNWWARGV